jgi:putative hydroxymethylpyrimidine transport system substrate-binding protein
MRRPLATLAALAAALLLAACGQKSESVQATAAPDHLTVMLDWFPNADHVGLYRAQAEGDFSHAGLDVTIRTPSDPSLPLKLLAAGKIDLAISYEPELLLARDRNVPLVAIAALVQRPLTSIISLPKARIRTVADLRGKRVGDAGLAYQHAYLDTILSRAGVPASTVHETNVGSDLVPALLSGRVDAILGGYWNYEGVQLAQLHKHPRIIYMNQVGVPTYDELVLVTTRKAAVQKVTEIRRFIQALGRGYASVRANPTAGVQSLLAASPGLDARLQTAAVKATLPAFFPAAGHPWGWLDPSAWRAYGSWMYAHRLISNPNALDEAESNDFLAGVGP